MYFLFSDHAVDGAPDSPMIAFMDALTPMRPVACSLADATCYILS